MTQTQGMAAASGSTLVPALESNPRRSRTPTVADPSPDGPPAPVEHPDPSDDGLGAMEAQSRALEREKATLTRRIELRRLQQEVEDLRAADASQTRQSTVPPPPTSPDSSDDPSSEDGTRRRGRRRGPRKRPRRRTISEGEAETEALASGRTAIDVSAALRMESALKVSDPPLYEGKNIKEHDHFHRHCETVFRLKPVTYTAESTRVTWASSFFRGRPSDLWARYEKENGQDHILWEAFVDLLLDWVQTPANRHLAVAEKFEACVQLPSQDVRGFSLYLQSLEDKLPEYSETHKKQHFLTKLRPELRRGIMSMEHVPETREDMIEAAARIEENLKQDKNEKRSRTGNAPPTGAASSSGGQQPRAPKTASTGTVNAPPKAGATGAAATSPNSLPLPSRSNLPSTDKSKIKCFGCQKMGHYRTECKEPAVRSATVKDKKAGNGQGQ